MGGKRHTVQGVSKVRSDCIFHCILRKPFNASLGKCTLIQIRNLSKKTLKAILNQD